MYLKLTGWKLTLSLFILMLMAGCGQETAQEAESQASIDSLSRRDPDSLYFSFSNGPVSPEFQRKWEVVVKGDSATGRILRIDQVLWQSTASVNRDSMKAFLLKLSNCQLQQKTVEPKAPCVGHSSYQLSFFQGGKILQGDAFRCGEQQGGTIQGEVKAAAELFIRLLPQMKSVVDTSLNGNFGI